MHCVNWAYRNVGFINRHSSTISSISTLKRLYSLGGYKLKFSSLIWSLNIFVYIDMSKDLQKWVSVLYCKVTKKFTDDISHNELLNLFEFDSSEKKRKMADFCFFLILRGEIDDAFCLSKINLNAPTIYNRSYRLFDTKFSRKRLHFSSPFTTMMKLCNLLSQILIPINIFIYIGSCQRDLNWRTYLAYGNI